MLYAVRIRTYIWRVQCHNYIIVLCKYEITFVMQSNIFENKVYVKILWSII